MATATVAGGAVVHTGSAGAVAALTPSELAAANQALASLNIGQSNSVSLLSGAGNDTFAGGVAGATRFLPGFSSDTVAGGSSLPQAGKAAMLAVARIPQAGDTAAGVKGAETLAANDSNGQLITLNDQTTIHLIGVNHDGAPKA